MSTHRVVAALALVVAVGNFALAVSWASRSAAIAVVEVALGVGALVVAGLAESLHRRP